MPESSPSVPVAVVVAPGASWTYSSYPLEADLQKFLEGTALGTDLSTLDLTAACYDAIASWEEGSGYIPFLVRPDAAPTIRYFDPPGPPASRGAFGLLRGGGMWLEIDGLTDVPTALTINGASYDGSVQYFMGPANAPAKGRPYTEIEFLFPVFGLPRGIAITGLWGYSTSLKATHWNAILQGAAYSLWTQLALGISGGLAAQVTGDHREDYSRGKDAGPIANEAGSWLDKFRGTLRAVRSV